jgi:hypothetical protein
VKGKLLLAKLWKNSKKKQVVIEFFLYRPFIIYTRGTGKNIEGVICFTFPKEGSH